MHIKLLVGGRLQIVPELEGEEEEEAGLCNSHTSDRSKVSRLRQSLKAGSRTTAPLNAPFVVPTYDTIFQSSADGVEGRSSMGTQNAGFEADAIFEAETEDRRGGWCGAVCQTPRPNRCRLTLNTPRGAGSVQLAFPVVELNVVGCAVAVPTKQREGHRFCFRVYDSEDITNIKVKWKLKSIFYFC